MIDNETLKMELAYYIELCYNSIDRVNSTRAKRTFYDHAFGTVIFMYNVLPIEDDYVKNLWNKWKPRFEEKLFGTWEAL